MVGHVWCEPLEQSHGCKQIDWQTHEVVPDQRLMPNKDTVWGNVVCKGGCVRLVFIPHFLLDLCMP